MQQLNIVARMFTEDIIYLASDTQTILVLGEAIETSMFDSIRGNQKLKVFDFVVSYYLSPCIQVILVCYCTAWALFTLITSFFAESTTCCRIVVEPIIFYYCLFFGPGPNCDTCYTNNKKQSLPQRA